MMQPPKPNGRQPAVLGQIVLTLLDDPAESLQIQINGSAATAAMLTRCIRSCMAAGAQLTKLLEAASVQDVKAEQVPELWTPKSR